MHALRDPRFLGPWAAILHEAIQVWPEDLERAMLDGPDDDGATTAWLTWIGDLPRWRDPQWGRHVEAMALLASLAHVDFGAMEAQLLAHCPRTRRLVGHWRQRPRCGARRLGFRLVFLSGSDVAGAALWRRLRQLLALDDKGHRVMPVSATAFADCQRRIQDAAGAVGAMPMRHTIPVWLDFCIRFFQLDSRAWVLARELRRLVEDHIAPTKTHGNPTFSLAILGYAVDADKLEHLPWDEARRLFSQSVDELSAIADTKRVHLRHVRWVDDLILRSPRSTLGQNLIYSAKDLLGRAPETVHLDATWDPEMFSSLCQVIRHSANVREITLTSSTAHRQVAFNPWTAMALAALIPTDRNHVRRVRLDCRGLYVNDVREIQRLLNCTDTTGSSGSFIDVINALKGSQSRPMLSAPHTTSFMKEVEETLNLVSMKCCDGPSYRKRGARCAHNSQHSGIEAVTLEHIEPESYDAVVGLLSCCIDESVLRCLRLIFSGRCDINEGFDFFNAVVEFPQLHDLELINPQGFDIGLLVVACESLPIRRLSIQQISGEDIRNTLKLIEYLATTYSHPHQVAYLSISFGHDCYDQVDQLSTFMDSCLKMLCANTQIIFFSLSVRPRIVWSHYRTHFEAQDARQLIQSLPEECRFAFISVCERNVQMEVIVPHLDKPILLTIFEFAGSRIQRDVVFLNE